MTELSKSKTSQKYLFLPAVPKTCKLSSYQTLILIVTLDQSWHLIVRSYLATEVPCAFKRAEAQPSGNRGRRILSSRPAWATQQDPATTSCQKYL